MLSGHRLHGLLKLGGQSLLGIRQLFTVRFGHVLNFVLMVSLQLTHLMLVLFAHLLQLSLVICGHVLSLLLQNLPLRIEALPCSREVSLQLLDNSLVLSFDLLEVRLGLQLGSLHLPLVFFFLMTEFLLLLLRHLLAHVGEVVLGLCFEVLNLLEKSFDLFPQLCLGLVA